jgi:uncharacterized protein YyaL (SSP411 family)
MMRIILLLLISCGTGKPRAAAEPEEPLRSATAEQLEGPWSNRLLQASSPYLAMHGHDPVDWRPWGPDAMAEAERRNVPIFLSIGYYACHWCHVMHKESFKDPAVAAYMNDHFVPIKVDREERPDIDSLYMDAVHLLNQGNGGWPASLWLTPDGTPFYAGTYFPPSGRYGRPGFIEVLQQISTDWTDKAGPIRDFSKRIKAKLDAQAVPSTGSVLPEGVGASAASGLVSTWDAETRGWGQRTQFPMSPSLQFLLSYAVLHDDPAAMNVVAGQLQAMDSGGIHDHLGGGFHRYTVDKHWAVPHFEKMLYDNGQLLAVYSEAALAIGEPRFAQAAADLADFLLREMQSDGGAFYSSQSADSEGEEGTFYVWTPDQIRSQLEQAGIPDPEPFFAAYGVTDAGNFEHNRTVLIRQSGDPEDPVLKAARAALYTARAEREHPPTDDKLVVAWNGLAIGGLARTARFTDEPRYLRAAQQAASHVLSHRGPQGQLPRILADNSPLGVLEDYAFMGNGLLDLYEADHDPRWLLAADSITGVMLQRFLDPATGTLYQADSAVQLLSRKSDATDGSEPSGVGRALQLLCRLRSLGAPSAPAETIDSILLRNASLLTRAPRAAVSLADAADRMSRRSTELVIATERIDHPLAQAMIAAFNEELRPHTVLAVVTPDHAQALAGMSAIIGKTPGTAGARAFVCHDGVCHQPTSDLGDLRRLLKQKD